MGTQIYNQGLASRIRIRQCMHKARGAVRLTSAVGIKELPNPVLGGPFSISHDDGASTEVTGSLVSWRA